MCFCIIKVDRTHKTSSYIQYTLFVNKKYMGNSQLTLIFDIWRCVKEYFKQLLISYVFWLPKQLKYTKLMMTTI